MREDVDDIADVVVSSEEMNAVQPQVSIADAFRCSMRNLAASVCVVTSGTGEDASGFTATSVVSLSVDTPALMVSLNRNSASWSLVQASRKFVVNILSRDHKDIAETFAGRRGLNGRDRYIDPSWLRIDGSVPRLRGALAVIECDLEEAIQRYSHAILIGKVTGVGCDHMLQPLVYWQGGYGSTSNLS